MTLDHLIALNDEIAALVRAGVPLERGLAELGGDMPGRLGEIATALAERLRPRRTPGPVPSWTRRPRCRRLIGRWCRRGCGPAGCPPRSRPWPLPPGESAKPPRRRDRRQLSALGLCVGVGWGGAVHRLAGPELAAGFRSMDVPGERFFALLTWLGRGAWYWGPVGPAAVLLLVLFGGRPAAGRPCSGLTAVRSCRRVAGELPAVCGRTRGGKPARFTLAL